MTNGDWLIDHKEVPQTFNLYNRPTIRNDVTPERNKIYFFVTDKTTPKDFISKLKMYCEAFYLGLQVEIMYPKNTQTSKEFMDQLQIPNRDGYEG